MVECIKRLFYFLLTLSIKLKMMSDEDFLKLLKDCDYQQRLYAIYLRYWR
jgi:hypothetical protein